MWSIKLRASAGICGVWMCAGVHECALVYAGVRGCVQKFLGVCECVWGMNFQNIYWRIESLHQRTLIRILYEFFFIPTYYILNPNKYCLLLGKCHDKRAGPPSFSAYNFRSRERWSEFAKRSFNQQFGGKFEFRPTPTTAISLYSHEILIFWFLKKLYIKKVYV